MNCRSFLLLQGVASPFFSELEKALNNAGVKALKINYCGGDLLSGRFFSTALKHLNFRKKIDELPAFYQQVFKEYQITDIILFGDTRPVHIPAIKLAKENNINIHVYEEGYTRPCWITLEKDGVNAHSNLSKDPEWYLQNANKLSKVAKPSGYSLAVRGWHDIRYHVAKTLLKPYFPYYKSHRPDHFIREYWGFIKRFPSLKFYYNKKSKQSIDSLLASNKPFYLLPLQLNADSQIRLHSTVNSVTDVIHKTIRSFSKYADKKAILVIKNHPLDPWFVDYPKVIKTAAQKHKLDENRILYLEAGDLDAMLKKAKGTVLVNSTVGISSITAGCPVIALGTAIYDMPGLTFQGSLDEFWTRATTPDKKLFKAFNSVMIEKTQINGGFYNQKAIKMAVDGSLPAFKVGANIDVDANANLNVKAAPKTQASTQENTQKTSNGLISEP